MIALLTLFNASWATCADYANDPNLLRDLEAFATKGALDKTQKSCLEASYSVAELQTTKNKISRVLLVNAYANNTETWAQLTQRHLDEVDRSDPDIAYLYAFYLFNNDKADSGQVIEWTETALERRDAWEGDVYVSRVYGLMRLRSFSGLTLWEMAEKERQKGQAPEEMIDRIRDNAKTYAREWVDFAKASGRSTAKPLEVCMSITGSKAACGAE